MTQRVSSSNVAVNIYLVPCLMTLVTKGDLNEADLGFPRGLERGQDMHMCLKYIREENLVIIYFHLSWD